MPARLQPASPLCAASGAAGRKHSHGNAALEPSPLHCHCGRPHVTQGPPAQSVIECRLTALHNQPASADRYSCRRRQREQRRPGSARAGLLAAHQPHDPSQPCAWSATRCSSLCAVFKMLSTRDPNDLQASALWCRPRRARRPRPTRRARSRSGRAQTRSRSPRRAWTCARPRPTWRACAQRTWRAPQRMPCAPRSGRSAAPGLSL